MYAYVYLHRLPGHGTTMSSTRVGKHTIIYLFAGCLKSTDCLFPGFCAYIEVDKIIICIFEFFSISSFAERNFFWKDKYDRKCRFIKVKEKLLICYFVLVNYKKKHIATKEGNEKRKHKI